MTVQFDTSGVVTYFDRTTHHTESVTFDRLSPFVQGYIEALFLEVHEKGIRGPDGHPRR